MPRCNGSDLVKVERVDVGVVVIDTDPARAVAPHGASRRAARRGLSVEAPPPPPHPQHPHSGMPALRQILFKFNTHVCLINKTLAAGLAV